jgi:hypothetical protein
MIKRREMGIASYFVINRRYGPEAGIRLQYAIIIVTEISWRIRDFHFSVPNYHSMLVI